jgi:hypothetical protein
MQRIFGGSVFNGRGGNFRLIFGGIRKIIFLDGFRHM